jgi:hypothetical protein
MNCPEAHASIGKVRIDRGDLYYFSMGDCQGFGCKAQCLTPGEREGKALPGGLCIYRICARPRSQQGRRDENGAGSI